MLQDLDFDHLPIFLIVPLPPLSCITSIFLFRFLESSLGCLCSLHQLTLSFCRGLLFFLQLRFSPLWHRVLSNLLLSVTSKVTKSTKLTSQPLCMPRSSSSRLTHGMRPARFLSQFSLFHHSFRHRFCFFLLPHDFSNCYSPMELASADANYLRSHLFVSLSKASLLKYQRQLI